MGTRTYVVAGLLAFAVGAVRTTAGDRPAWVARGRQGMVATDAVAASEAGAEILRSGGNAVDAAAAVSFALAVTRPESTGLGGGGFMIIRMTAGRRPVALDYRETAPASATSDMYSDDGDGGNTGPPRSRFGVLAAGVPGTVAGHAAALKRFGTLDWQTLLAPAIRLAEEGYAADAHYVRAARKVRDRYRRYPVLAKTCGYVHRRHLRGGKLPRVGDRVVQPALGRLLRTIAENGPDGFYRGAVAEAIERTIRTRGGRITRADLAGYRPVWRKPIQATYRGHDLWLMPPPSSGGVCIAETLNILEHLDYAGVARSDPGRAMHYVIEAMKHAFADRARWLGDPDFTTVPVGRLTAKAYAGSLRDAIAPGEVSEIGAYGSLPPPDDAGTSHFCIVDRWGNCVAATETINTEFGSLAAVDEWGLILNNEMDDFAARPGEPNAFGLIQSQRNAVAPGKRPLSSMSPTIVTRDGQVVLLIGGSGGPRIISAVINVLLAALDRDMPLPQAVKAARVHHQWRPNEVFFDGPMPQVLTNALRSSGHTVSSEMREAAVQAIGIDGGEWVGVSDPRKGGRPAGY